MFIKDDRIEYSSTFDVWAGVDVAVVNTPNCGIVLIKQVCFDNVRCNNIAVIISQDSNGFPPSCALIYVSVQCPGIVGLGPDLQRILRFILRLS